MQRACRRVWGVPWPDLLMATVLVLAALTTTLLDAGALHPAAETVSMIVAASVVLRTRATAIMAFTASAGIVVLAFLPGAETPLWAFAAALLVAFSVTDHLRGMRMWVCLGVLLTAEYVIQVRTSDSAVEALLTPLILTGAPALAGWLLARSRRQTRQLRELTEQLAASRAEAANLAAEAERARLARDLHDVLGHTLSSIAVQAGAAGELLEPGHPAGAPIERVRVAAHDGLDEVRSALSHRPPTVGLERIPALVLESGAALDATGSAPAIEPAFSTAIFRIVQEALTNARRHAPGGAARVRLRFDADAIDVVVVNQLRDTPSHTASGTEESGDGARRREPPGHGLAGMRERASAYGGSLGVDRGETEWVVHARFPLEDEHARPNENTRAGEGPRPRRNGRAGRNAQGDGKFQGDRDIQGDGSLRLDAHTQATSAGPTP
jgi:signal transduction histidine kinase